MTASHVRVAVVADGGGWEDDTVRVTGIFVRARFPTLIVMTALWVPGASPLVLAVTVSCAVLIMGAVAGDTVSQETLSETVRVTWLERVR